MRRLTLQRSVSLLGSLGSLALLCLAPTSVFGVIVYETDFVTKASGGTFNAATIQFQDGWLGQNFTDVDPTGSGRATTPATGAFPRNLNNRGALGNTAGGGGAGETSGPGFGVGDQLRITAGYQFTLPAAGNQELSIVGVRDNFATGGFNASPKIGMELFYSSFDPATGGSLKLFGNTARNGFAGADNAFALFASGFQIGLDPNGSAGPVDLVSDLLEVSIELTFLGANQWQTTDLTLVNADTSTTIADAASKPAILTEVQTVPSLNDLFLGVQWARSNGPVSDFDSIRFEYIAAVPEPTAPLCAGLVSLLIAARTRRS